VSRFAGGIGFTPKPESKDAVTQRHAELKLDADGNLEGNLTIMFDGQEALIRRLRAIDQDEAQRRKELEESVQHSLPQGAVVKLLSAGAWETSETPLTAQFQVQVPNFASRAGQRLVLRRRNAEPVERQPAGRRPAHHRLVEQWRQRAFEEAPLLVERAGAQKVA